MEDESAVAFPLRRYLARLDLEVDWARELAEAEALLASHSYRVVIADLRLGGSHHSEGLDLLSHVHRHCPETRVILLTAYFTPEIEAEALRWGAVAVLRKPQSLAEISRLVFESLGV
ncbi:MAG TPA: response regulator [Thermoanaerobaculia bacterium]|nr:response regulator [Thermoanaerobaculia bacterium]